jgi:hypothetical protein
MNGPPEKANGPCQGAAASKDRIINRPISINPSQGCGKENLGGHLIDRFGHIHSNRFSLAGRHKRFRQWASTGRAVPNESIAPDLGSNRDRALLSGDELRPEH